MPIFFFFLFFLSAFLYTLVGLGGGSAYAMILAISDVKRETIPPTILFLNIVSTFIGSINYKKHIPKNKIFFLLLSGVGGVSIGAKIKIEDKTFFIVFGLALITSSIFSFIKDKYEQKNEKQQEKRQEIDSNKENKIKKILPFFSFFIGILAGITGIGGGIYLSPILILSGFPVKETASITSIYIFINSLIGFVHHIKNFDLSLAPLSIPVIVGASLGSYLGSKKLKPKILKTILNLIILFVGTRITIKGIKM